MKCPKCQAENPDDAEFCSLCYTRFYVQLRSQEIDDAAKRMREKHQGSRLCCPSCQEMSPLDTQFCLKCGFVFEDLEALMVSEEEVERIRREKEDLKTKEEETLLSEPVVISADSDGVEIMRNLTDHLAKGLHPRIHARGRNDITYAMKIVALLGQDMRTRGGDVLCRVKLITEGTITHLEDVELEIVLENI